MITEKNQSKNPLLFSTHVQAFFYTIQLYKLYSISAIFVNE